MFTPTQSAATAAVQIDDFTPNPYEKEVIEAFKDWGNMIKPYTATDWRKASWQMFESFGLFIAIWVAMYYSLRVSYFLTIGLAAFNAAMLTKIFIIQHDCGHNSFVSSNLARRIIGNICSVFSLIPYTFWAKTHNAHHTFNGQLEDEIRDLGDLHYYTVEEFRALSPLQQTIYKIYRSPFILFICLPMYYLFIHGRIFTVNIKSWSKERIWIWRSNAFIFSILFAIAYLIGWKSFLMVQMPIWIMFAIGAIWFFYVQHQHEHTYKAWKNDWQYILAAMRGSTHFKFSAVGDWLTGNIGYHHIHHLSAKIPNYNLRACHHDNPLFAKYAQAITFTQSFRCALNKLWDEKQQRMITFSEYYNMEAQRAK
jgi:acyl-lipid omega-6 desaturase (Delta-12 desaturase)